MASSNLHRYTVQEALNIKTGAGGKDYITASAPADASSPTITTLNTHKYVKIKALTDIVLTASSTDTDIWDTLALVAVPAGTSIYGNFGIILLTNAVEGSETMQAVVHRSYSTD
tara:strand:+ start:272 stop:613 length:342 start_codon:yes stop_codon:yes gene_type:complete